MSDTELHRIHLKLKGMSQRGVQYRVLTPSEIDQVEKTAAVEANKETTMMELNNAVSMLGLEMMIAAVTEPVAADKFSEASWKSITASQLHLDWSKFFNAKDTALLKRVYQREHVVSNEEVDEIMAGKIAVVVD